MQAQSSDRIRGTRILMVGNDPEYFLMHRLPLASALADAGIDLHVAIPFARADRRFHGCPFELHRLSLRRGSLNPYREGRVVFELAKLSRRLRPRLVHHITIKPVLYGSAVARALGTPCVVNSITGLGYVFSSSAAGARFLRSLVLPGMRYGCNSRNVMMLFENSDDLKLYCALGISEPSRCRVVPSSGIDPSGFAPHVHERGAVTVMLLSRMLWDKGVAEFVAAARTARRVHPSTRFVLVGGTDPNPESIPRSTLQAWHDEGVIEYWGWRSDVSAVLQRADILCLPSYREGLPRTLLEGGAAGLALVTTDVPGCRDAVRDGVSGVLVPPRNADALASAVVDLIDNVERRREMGMAARADMAVRFSVASVVEKTRSAYVESLDLAV